MSTMLEKVAMAISGNPDVWSTDLNEAYRAASPYKVAAVRALAMDKARAALMAMREPTGNAAKAMHIAAHNGPARHPDAVGQWTAMIDAILSESNQPKA